MQDCLRAVWSIPYVSVAFSPSSKQNFIAYRSSKVSDCIFEIHQLWQSGFRRVYSNRCCSCSLEHEIIKIGQSFHKMYSNNILNSLVSTINLNTCIKKSGNLLKEPQTCMILLYGEEICFRIYVVYQYNKWNVLCYIYLRNNEDTNTCADARTDSFECTHAQRMKQWNLKRNCILKDSMLKCICKGFYFHKDVFVYASTN